MACQIISSVCAVCTPIRHSSCFEQSNLSFQKAVFFTFVYLGHTNETSLTKKFHTIEAALHTIPWHSLYGIYSQIIEWHHSYPPPKRQQDIEGHIHKKGLCHPHGQINNPTSATTTHLQTLPPGSQQYLTIIITTFYNRLLTYEHYCE